MTAVREDTLQFLSKTAVSTNSWRKAEFSVSFCDCFRAFGHFIVSDIHVLVAHQFLQSFDRQNDLLEPHKFVRTSGTWTFCTKLISILKLSESALQLRTTDSPVDCRRTSLCLNLNSILIKAFWLTQFPLLKDKIQHTFELLTPPKDAGFSLLSEDDVEMSSD